MEGLSKIYYTGHAAVLEQLQRISKQMNVVTTREPLKVLSPESEIT
jgi:hypothetical protein